ncbi:glycosyltransferase family 39 protein [Fortiea sp. LEGE XX443]|uniref:ArnT family glycosyltransferase n=1 Tax=Fortiea sp. LEGE XX443 TaxID=1828611 RepID=UPI00188201C6|nr:glycosyltransferase family 39 protein [Fortiea sp. LEGE XX443]MBE9008013.1 glycosyltransferase family 39 protein [Fortiea sp. LEGE XX443]
MQIAQKWLAQKTNQSVLCLLFGGLLFRATIAFWLYPTFDEAYYYLYSLHLDWSYFDHPAMVALTTGFGPWLTGEVSQFSIRLGALLCYTGSLIFLYLTSKRIFSAKAANLTLAIATITPIFQIGFGILSLPDSPLMFFWSAGLYCAVAEFLRQPLQDEIGAANSYIPSYRLAILGILVGLACNSKYHGFILGLGLVGFCLTSPPHRLVVRSPWAWLSLGLFMITISPIVFWNMQHDWVSFSFQSERAVPKSGYNFLNVGLVYLAQVAYLFPTIGFPLSYVSLQPLLRKIKQVFSKKSLTYEDNLTTAKLLILWVSLPVILGFTFIGGYRQILPAWAMPGFWGTTLLLGNQAVIWGKKSRTWVRRWLLGSGIMIASIILILLLQLTIGILQKPSQYALMGGILPPQHDPSKELIDIQQLRRSFSESPTLKTALQNSSFIFTNRYYLGGPIAMSLQPLAQIPITCFDIGNDIRGFAFWSKAEQWLGKDALYITTAPFNLRKDLMASYRTHFRSLDEIEQVVIRRGGVPINVVYVYQAKTLLKPYPRSYGF